MSRIGKRPIPLPKGVTVTVANGFFEVKGAKGTIKRPFPASLTFEQKDGEANVGIKTDVNFEEANRQHGTTRALINSAVVGVSKGFRANLKLEGTGYKAELKGQTLALSLGLSHPVNHDLPKGISVKIPPESKGTILQMESFDRALLGQTIANLQSYRFPEPYKGKGVQVIKVEVDEGAVTIKPQTIRRKAGKAGGKGGK